MQFTYVLVANGGKAFAIKSDYNWLEMDEYLHRHCKPLHPDSTDRVFKWGITDYINPKIMSLNDFGNYCPALIGIK